MASHTTRDHDEIRDWAEAHGATPTVVSRSSGMLRFEFAADPPAQLEGVSWGDFFSIFDEHGLELVYDDKPGSRFHKLVYPESIAAAPPRRPPAPPRARATRTKVQAMSAPARAQARAGKAAPKAKPRTVKPAAKKPSAIRRPPKAA